MRLIWAIIGFLGLALALVGVVLPIMPTVPFLLVAAFGFARSSPRFHDWLLGHPVFGRQIRDWQQSGAIARRVKVIVTLSMVGSAGLGFVLLPPHVWWAQLVVIAMVATFILTRPEPAAAAVRAPGRGGSSA